MAIKKEHLSIFLPFDLKLLRIFETGNAVPAEVLLCGVSINDIMCIEYASDEHTPRYSCDLDQIKPLYRRLSQITKPITHNRETFIPAERLAAEGYKFAKYDPKIGYGYKKIGQKPGDKIGYLNLDIMKWPYEYFIQLVEMHFDVFSKIDSGDASVKK